MKTLGYSQRAIKATHRMQDESEYMLKSEKEPQIRQRADPNKIKLFASWLVESNTLVSGKVDFETWLQREPFILFSFKGSYGLTALRMDSGENKSNYRNRHFSYKKRTLLLNKKSIVKKLNLKVFVTENSSTCSLN